MKKTPDLNLPGEFNLSREDMLSLAHKASELLIDRFENMPDSHVWDGEFRKGLEKLLMEDAPEDGLPAEDVIDRAVRDVLPYGARLDHSRSFAFIPSSPTWPSIIADFIAAGYNYNVATWLTASGPSQLELVVIDWFRRWIGYPDSAAGLLTSGSSAAILDAFVVAREAAGNPIFPVVYMSDQSHGSQIRSAKIIGIRPECIRVIPVDENFRIDMDSLASAVKMDRVAGLNPIVVCANAGVTSNGAVDPLEAMADFCKAEGIWLHVDAAYGGFAVLSEKGKQLLQGIERSDSICLDAHKWLSQPYETGGLLVKDGSKLEDAFSMKHDILQDSIWGANHPNISDRGLQLSRSFRALKIWVSIQTFGLGAFRRSVERTMLMAEKAQEYIEQSDILELLSPSSLGILCFRVNPTGVNAVDLDELNKSMLAQVFWGGRAFISSTMVRGKFSLRMCVSSHHTTWDDVHETLVEIEGYGLERRL